MKKFWAYISNSQYSVGTTGQTVYLFDKNENEIKKFKDIIYGYLPLFSPDGKIFVVKSTEGRLAVYSLENYSLIKKFRFSKVNGAQDDNFCFSPDSKLLINLERHIDSCHSAISVYNTEDFSLIAQIPMRDNMMVDHIEFGEKTNEYYILGFVRGYTLHHFVAKFKDNSLTDIVKIPEEVNNFYRSYLHLKAMGFTEKKYQWLPNLKNFELEKLKNADYSLENLHNKYK